MQQSKIIEQLLSQNSRLIEENSKWREMFFEAFNHRPEIATPAAAEPESEESPKETERRENALKNALGGIDDFSYETPTDRP